MHVLQSRIATQQSPRFPKTTKIAYTKAKYSLKSSVTTQSPPRPPKTTKIAYTGAKYVLRLSVTTQRPPRSLKTTQITYSSNHICNYTYCKKHKKEGNLWIRERRC